MRGTAFFYTARAARPGWGRAILGFQSAECPTALTGGNNSNFGWTAGFGLEWAFWNNWSLRAEYDFIGLGNHTYTVAPGPTIFSGDVITYNYPSFSIMTLGVNYKFGW